MRNDTIAAVATAVGTGAISVIRVSGPETFKAIDAVFSRPTQNFSTHSAHYGHILDKEGKVIDSVLLLVMRNPKSYTGEDSVEISCHGSSLITQKVLERLFEVGVSPAEPGEFSLRAYLNGKLDLAQAEAVQKLIGAQNSFALQNAQHHLEGRLSKTIEAFQKTLLDIAATLEAFIDFPEEDLEFAHTEELMQKLKMVKEEVYELQNTFYHGKMIDEGLSLCLIGPPNVGKSSLMNALLGKERAIVTEIPGTTRDILEEKITFGHLHFKLIDTAGIRMTEEVIEKEGIRRSQKMMEDADFILLVLDATQPIQEDVRQLLHQAPKEKTLLIWNKIDLKDAPKDGIGVSAKQRLGLDSLQKAIEDRVFKGNLPNKESLAITSMRHFEKLKEVGQSIEKAVEGLRARVSAELVAIDIRSSLQSLASILGRDVTEDILDAIFSQFCLGK